MSKIIYKIIIVLFIVIILINLLSALNFPLLGIRTYRIGSGSMEPNLKVNDIIMVKSVDKYNVGDIVSFIRNGEIITHRIISINGDEIITRGDANNTEDAPIKIGDILGKKIYRFRFTELGNNILSNPITWVMIFITGMFITIISTYNGRRGRHAL